MWSPDSVTTITRTLNRLEEFPHEWIDVVHLLNNEVRSALACYRNNVEYNTVDPYVDNFPATIINAPPLIRLFMRYPLAEIMFDLWRAGTFDPRQQYVGHAQTYRSLIARERELLLTIRNRDQARRALFVERIVQRIEREHLYPREEQGNITLFRAAAEHVHDHPTWCPSLRLGFELFHSLVEDYGDALRDSDIGDISHAYALPYVDWLTTDRRIYAHVERVSRNIGIEYNQRIRRNLRELLPVLN